MTDMALVTVNGTRYGYERMTDEQLEASALELRGQLVEGKDLDAATKKNNRVLRSQITKMYTVLSDRRFQRDFNEAASLCGPGATIAEIQDMRMKLWRERRADAE